MNILAALRSALRMMTSSVPVLEEDFVLRAIVASAMLVQPLSVNPDPVAAVSEAGHQNPAPHSGSSALSRRKCGRGGGA
jgi:hypothetical protein